MAMMELTDQNFEKETQEGIVLVDFWAPWCGPCKMIAPVLTELDEELGAKVKIGKLNVDHNPTVTSHFQVMSIPTLLLLKDGNVVEKVSGFRSKEQLIELITPYV